MKTNGCSGECCKRFSFPLSPEQIGTLLDNHALGVDTHMKVYNFTPDYIGAKKRDLEYIRDMLIPLGIGDTDPQADDEPYFDKVKKNWDSDKLRYQFSYEVDVVDGLPVAVKANFYTCKHYDPQAKLCTQYESRPSMCKSFPNDSDCRYKDCCYTKQQKKRLEDVGEQIELKDSN